MGYGNATIDRLPATVDDIFRSHGRRIFLGLSASSVCLSLNGNESRVDRVIRVIKKSLRVRQNDRHHRHVAGGISLSPNLYHHPRALSNSREILTHFRCKRQKTRMKQDWAPCPV